MAYARELDSLRQELRLDTAGTIVFWPKLNGANVAVSAVGGECYFQIYDASGTSIQAQTNIDGTLVGDVDRFDIPADAISTLDEDYRADIFWTVASGSVVYRDAVFFDVVRYPYGPPSVSLNDLLEERPDVGEVLDRHGQLLGYTAGDTAKETAAAIYAVRARVEIDALVRTQVTADAAVGSARAPVHPTTGSVYTRPNLILNRERLNRVERKLAMRLVYEGDQTGGEDDEGNWLFLHYKRAAEYAWASVGPLKYDQSEDMVPDTVKDDIGRSVVQRRVQA